MTYHRSIDLSIYDADPRVIAWLEANGLDPANTPAAQEITVDGDKITLLAFVTEDGHKMMDPTTSDPSWLKEIRTVPLTSAPENFGL